MTPQTPLEQQRCDPSYNLSHVEGGPRCLRRICAWQDQERKEIFEAILHEAGGRASHGICKVHEPLLSEWDEEETKVMKRVDDRVRRWKRVNGEVVEL